MASKPAWAEQIARERIDLLFEEAEEQFPDHGERADRYVELARRIAMRFNLPLPEEHQRKFCSECGSFLRPGENAKVRVEKGVKKVKCEECGEVEKSPYSD